MSTATLPTAEELFALFAKHNILPSRRFTPMFTDLAGTVVGCVLAPLMCEVRSDMRDLRDISTNTAQAVASELFPFARSDNLWHGFDYAKGGNTVEDLQTGEYPETVDDPVWRLGYDVGRLALPGIIEREGAPQ